MRRITTTLLATALTALAIPAAASAHNGRHHRRHRRAHTVVFAPAVKSQSSGTAPAPQGEDAGTIASYEGGVLKITLADGSTVSGIVNESTQIQCGCPGDGGGEGSGETGWQHGEDDPGSSSQGPDGAGPGWQHGDDFRGNDGQEASSCNGSSLVAGAKVRDAALDYTGSGAVWERIDLVPSTQTTSS